MVGRLRDIEAAINEFLSGNILVRCESSSDEVIGPVSLAINRLLEETAHRQSSLLRLSAAVEQAPVSVVITDCGGLIQYVNPCFTKNTGYTYEEAVGSNPRILKSGYTTEEVYRELWGAISDGKVWHGELHNKRKNGDLFWEYAVIAPVIDDYARIVNFIAIKEDISIRKEFEKRLIHTQNFDELTGLPNRAVALDRLCQAIAANSSFGKIVSALIVKVDGLSRANHIHGHKGGDLILKQAAERISEIVFNDLNTVSRIGGTEFLVILQGISTPSIAESVAKRLIEALSQPFNFCGEQIFLSSSIGLSFSPIDGTDHFELLRNAHSALMNARNKSCSGYRLFMPEMDKEARERQSLDSELHSAVTEGLINVFYQPLMDAKSGRLVGAEALARWQSHSGRYISPDKFIPLAEENGLIKQIGKSILLSACKDAAFWRSNYGAEFRVAVNISALQCSDMGFIEAIEKILQETGFPPELLEIELTERTLVADSHAATVFMEVARGMGIRLSIDDFGTGYSALGYLRKFPFTTLKIDKSFTSEISDKGKGNALISSIIQMAHALDLEVIAEGVENEFQREFLIDCGCEILQGYLLGHPVPADQFLLNMELL
jgi:diguanylate cyclase (GGDEF)-like protein/PAS domain S-box-containing protein